MNVERTWVVSVLYSHTVSVGQLFCGCVLCGHCRTYSAVVADNKNLPAPPDKLSVDNTYMSHNDYQLIFKYREKMSALCNAYNIFQSTVQILHLISSNSLNSYRKFIRRRSHVGQPTLYRCHLLLVNDTYAAVLWRTELQLRANGTLACCVHVPRMTNSLQQNIVPLTYSSLTWKLPWRQPWWRPVRRVTAPAAVRTRKMSSSAA